MDNKIIMIYLYEEETRIIRRYQKHLWKVGKINETWRETLTRIIAECGVELDIVERELAFENKRLKNNHDKK